MLSRYQHFMRLCELDGIVSARTLALAAGCSRAKAGAWLHVQCSRGRIVRVAVGRYGRSDSPRKPTPERELEWQRKSQKKIREKRRALGICQCGAPAPDHWKCFECRRVQTLYKRRQRAHEHAAAQSGPQADVTLAAACASPASTAAVSSPSSRADGGAL